MNNFLRHVARSVWHQFGPRAAGTRPKSSRTARLELEALDSRTLPTANAGGVVRGVAFIDANGNGTREPTEAVLPGAALTLTSTALAGPNGPSSLSVTVVTNGVGAFKIDNLVTGTYQLGARPPAGLPAQADPRSVAGPLVIDGTAGSATTLTRDVGFQGGPPLTAFLSGRFQTGTTAAFLRQAGSGEASANYRPFVSAPVADQDLAAAGPAVTIDLAGHFADPDVSNSQVTFNVLTNGVNRDRITLDLFDGAAPQTVANFFDYVNSGAYTNAVFTRLIPGFVLLAGAVRLNRAGDNLVRNDTRGLTVPNEFPVGAATPQNVQGSIALGQSGGDLNSGSDQFFFNLVNNATGSANDLDARKFTVFGQVVPADLPKLTGLAAAPTVGAGPHVSVQGVDLSNVPLNNYTGTDFPLDARRNNYVVIEGVTVNRREEFFRYQVRSSNPALVSAALVNEQLILTPSRTRSGVATITVTTLDRRGNAVQEAFTVTVRPRVTIAPDSPTNATALTASPIGLAPNGAAVRYTFQWQRNGADLAGATAARLDLSALSPAAAAGDSFTVKFTPATGPFANQTFTSEEVELAGVGPATLKVPVINSLVIVRDVSSAVTRLTAQAQANDPYGRPVTFTYQWFRNNVAVAGQTAQTLNLARAGGLRAGDVISVRVTPGDGELAGAPATARVTVDTVRPVTLRLPRVLSVAVQPNSPTAPTKLTAFPVTSSPDGRVVTTTFQWLKNGLPIPGQTAAALNLSAVMLNVGDVLGVRVTPNDGVLTGRAFTSQAVEVLTVGPVTFKLPTVTAAPITVDNGANVTRLTVNPTTDNPYASTPGRTVTVTFQWSKNGVAIPGATTAVLGLTGQAPAPNDQFSVAITPSDGTVTGPVFTNGVTVATVSPTTLKRPSVTGVTINRDSSSNVTKLTAVAATTDPNNLPVTTAFQWLKNGTAISGATAAALDLTMPGLNSAVGDDFTVRVTPSNMNVVGDPFTSQEVTITTVAPTTVALPVVTSATVTPNSLTDATTLTVNPVHSNPYGRTNTLAFQWLRNGTAISGATTATLNLTTVAGLSANDNITVQVTPSDGTLTGSVFTTQVVAVNTVSPITFKLPAVTAVEITADNDNNVTLLTATPTSTNPYGRTNTFAYQWLQNGTPIPGATSQNLSLTGLTVAVGDTFEALVTPSDGTLTGAQFDGGEVVTVATASPDPITLQP